MNDSMIPFLGILTEIMRSSETPTYLVRASKISATCSQPPSILVDGAWIKVAVESLIAYEKTLGPTIRQE
jgi:hypothetical protein